MVTKCGDEFVSDLEDDYGDEGGEDDLDDFEAEAALLEQQLSEKQKAKLAEAGVSIKDYLAGNGPDLTDDEDYDDEEQGENDFVEGEEGEDDDDEEEVNGDKRARGH